MLNGRDRVLIIKPIISRGSLLQASVNTVEISVYVDCMVHHLYKVGFKEQG